MADDDGVVSPTKMQNGGIPESKPQVHQHIAADEEVSFKVSGMSGWIWDKLGKLWKCTSPSAPSTVASGSKTVAGSSGRKSHRISRRRHLFGKL